VYLVNTVLLPRALYRLKLSSATDEQIDQIHRVRCARLLLVRHTYRLLTHQYYLAGTWGVDGRGGKMR
jgi:hypothetical protein